MQVSIITPSAEREMHLQLLYQTIKNQEMQSWEWLICDSSCRPSRYFSKIKDDRVRYFYDKDNLSIGYKRNLLIENAKNPYIVHFDDDDYYAPRYLTRVCNELKHADLFKLSCFFCYSLAAKDFFYWDTTNADSVTYVLSPLSGNTIREFDFSKKIDRRKIKQKKFGYGFSYSYKKTMTEKIKFENLNFAEDTRFIYKALRHKHCVKIAEDQEGLVLHMIHDMNMSESFPQYRLPPFVSHRFFPKAKQFLKKYPKLIV